MPDPIFAAGTTATIKDEPSGSPTALANLVGLGGNESVMSFGEITGLADTTLKKRPSRTDPGTFTMTFMLDDTTIASNQLTTLKAKRDAKQKVTVAVNLPAAFDDAASIITYTGYLASVGQPEISLGDEVLKYTVSLQVTA